MGWGIREHCGSNKRWTGSLKNLTTGLIWLVTRVGGMEGGQGGRWGGAPESSATVGGWGEAWGGGPWRGGGCVGRWPMEGGGEMGGEVHWFPLLGSLENLTTGLIWQGGGGKGGGVGRWPMEMGGGTREQCGSNKIGLP